MRSRRLLMRIRPDGQAERECGMELVFLTVLQMGISFSGLLLAACAARFLLKNVSKSMICMLWLIVGLRLLLPVEIVTDFSLLPEKTGMVMDDVYRKSAAGSQELLNDAKLPDADAPSQSDAPGMADASGILDISRILDISGIPDTSGVRDISGISDIFRMARMGGGIFALAGNGLADSAVMPGIVTVAAWIWMAGIAGMCMYLGFSWHRVKKSVAAAVPAEYEGIRFYQCDGIGSPFLFGFWMPKIYVPFTVAGQELSFVLKHEKAHKRHGDHLKKLAGFLLLAVYWFHPFVWAAYVLFCRDIELACDERVVWETGEDCKKAYAQSLLSCSANHRAADVCPVAFGETGVKNRVKYILNYKKPKFVAVLAAAAVCAAVTLGFATEAKSGNLTQQKQEVPEAGNEKKDENMKKRLTGSIQKWAEAFCGRDAEAVCAMLDEAGRKALREQNLLEGEHSFGWSSPWPWGLDESDEQPNYTIVSVDEHTAEILYYAWTSDPHVTVWHQVIQFADLEDGFQVQDASCEILDSIRTAKQFDTAYPDSVIDHTKMDYLHGNGAGGALSRNAPADDTGALFSPDTAAVYLLNVEPDPSVVRTEVTEQNGDVIVTFHFLEDGSSARVKMVQMKDGNEIWVPQTAVE